MNELFNKKHDIKESQVMICKDLTRLHDWKLLVKKDLIELDGKLKSIEARQDDPESVKRMTHARNMQDLLLDVIDNRIRELSSNSDREYNDAFVSVSRDLLSHPLYDEIVRETEKRITINS
jgi:hypothetical protein